MPVAVEAVLGEDHRPGVSWVLNDPYRGGTHLPDITVITPVFADGAAHLGFAASRAHHADVGGRIPGSMPADSRTLAEEGVVIAPRVLDEAAIDELAARMRQPDERRADLRAQLAANRIGVRRTVELAARIGLDGLRAGYDAVLDYAERRTRACIAAMPDGTREATDVLEVPDGDLELRVRATVAGDTLTLDFAGSADQVDGNLNCPLAVTRSACFFAVRVLTDPDIPSSAGAHRPVTVTAPEGSLLNARPPAAVVGGNVETSSPRRRPRAARLRPRLRPGHDEQPHARQRALHLLRDDRRRPGRVPRRRRAVSGVHVAMSNTLNTPVEALEREFPLHVTQYAIRRGSGGDGAPPRRRRRDPGGAGAGGRCTYSLITERRRHAPPGADGGQPGATGRNTVDGADVGPKALGTLRAGQRLRIETPGGGGHGAPAN